MYAWFVAGLTLGFLLNSLVRRALRSPSLEITYLTFLSLFDKRSTTHLAQKAAEVKRQRQEKPLSAAAGRVSLL